MRGLVPTLVLISVVTSAVASLGAPLLETIAREDHVSVGTAQWTLTLPILVGAVGTPLFGRLGDGPARKAVVLWILTMVLGGSVLAAIPSSTFALLLVGRGLQGLGYALSPLTMSEARDSLPPSCSGPAIAVLAIASTTGTGLAYPITGVVDDTLGLHATFGLGAVVALVALAISWTVLPPSHKRSRTPLDVPGAVLIGASLLALLLAISQGNSWGWSSGPVLTLLVVSAVLAGAWVWCELSTRHPLVDLSLLRHGAVVVTDVTGLLMAVAMYMFFPLLTDFVQAPPSAGYGFGSSVVVVGLMLVPFSVLSACASRVAAALGRQIGAHRVLPIGAMLMAVAMLFFTLTGGALWEAFLAAGLMGVGVGFGFAVMPGLIVRAVPPEETGSALAFAQVIRFVGFALGSGISAAILTAHTQPGSLLPERSGFTVAMAAGAGVSVLAALVSIWLGRSAGSGSPQSPDDAPVGTPVAPAIDAVME